MATIPVVISHRGKRYDVDVDTSQPGELFKYQIFSLTGVEPERQKVLVKGGQVKDDTDLSKLNLKPRQVIMLMGTPGKDGAEIMPPAKMPKFIEDMTEAELASQAGALPPGLLNLGNTCYLNSTLQALRAVPELGTALSTYSPTDQFVPHLDITIQLKELFRQLSRTSIAIPPFVFLNALRHVFPQFAEKARGHPDSYAQQDAEEAWSQIISKLKQSLKLKDGESEVSFVDKYMSGEFSSTLQCDDPAAAEAGEQPTLYKDKFLKLNCHIDAQTNHLRDGIIKGLSENIEKKSEVLDRELTYTKSSKISRLPKYLTVHFIRFFWKRDVQKKAKIMRKVTFPRELDAVEFCTDELRKALIPVRDRVREVVRQEEDIKRKRARRKTVLPVDDIPENQKDKGKDKGKDKEKAPTKPADGDVEMGEGETFKTDAEIEAEEDASLLAAKKELNALIDPELRQDDGANQSGIYQLRAVVTHQGISADSGHYTAYVKKPGDKDPETGKVGEEDGSWYWFNDDKVEIVGAEKVDALAGGGESHSALILMYKALPLPTAEGIVE